MKNSKLFEEALLKTLLENRRITKEERNALLKRRVTKKSSQIQNILEMNILSESELIETMAPLYGAKALLEERKITISTSTLSSELFDSYRVILDEDNALYFFEPVFESAWKEIQERVTLTQKYLVLPSVYRKLSEEMALRVELKKLRSVSTNEQLHSLPQEEVATSFSNELLSKCYELKASDIHIEPMKEGFRVRMRMNGVLEEFGYYDALFFPSLTSRIKLLANLNIAEKRETQDGALLFQKKRGRGGY